MHNDVCTKTRSYNYKAVFKSYMRKLCVHIGKCKKKITQTNLMTGENLCIYKGYRKFLEKIHFCKFSESISLLEASFASKNVEAVCCLCDLPVKLCECNQSLQTKILLFIKIKKCPISLLLLFGIFEG